MKVILVSPLPPPAGGIATWTEQYLKSKEAIDNEVKLVNSAVTGDRIKHLNKKKIKDEFNRVLKLKREIESELKIEDYDVLHYNSSGSTLGMLKDYICLCKVKNKVKIVMHFHCDTSYKVNSFLSKQIFFKLLKLSDKVLTLNTRSKTHIYELSKIESTIIPNFIIPFKRTKSTVEDSIRSIVFVGHITYDKGHSEILTIARNFPDITFKLIGSYQENDKNLHPSNVEYLGEVSKENVIQELNLADLFFFPSHTEGFPLAVLEAMAMGLPIVATNVGAIPDMLENKGGIIVDVFDVENMIKAINKLNHDKVTREKMSIWNIKKVENVYSLDNVLKKLFSIYEDSLLK